jgi:mannitol 2-dehydrogenase
MNESRISSLHSAASRQPATPAVDGDSPAHWPARLSPDQALTEKNLSQLPSSVRVPDYDRSSLTPAVVHIGVGGFHRAHQAVYFDDLAQRGISTDWGIVGVGLHRPQMGEVLSDQDHLYTVVTRGPEGDDVRVVGALVDYLFAPEDPEAVLQVLADPTTRLVTLSITGTAYPSDGLDPEQEEVRADVEHPEAPGTAFGYLVEGLDRRRRAGVPAFTVLSCDNVQHNGVATRNAVLATARLRDPSLADWIEAEVCFPGSMVDRITPETTPEGRDGIADAHGVADRWPVITEPFRQWIVEDRFCLGRPPLDQVGVQFVDDVHPYEVMKTRMLNGAHSALGHLGRLAGFETTDQAMADPVLRSFVDGYLQEVSALLPEVPGIDLDDYRQTLLERFSNPQISDRLSRLCRRSSTKVPSYVLPSVRAALDQDMPRDHLVLAVASWLRYLQGEDFAGGTIEIEDAHADRLRPLALEGDLDPRPLLAQYDIFASLGECPRFTGEVEQALRLLQGGPLEAVAALSTERGPARQESAA